jgi:hypothetical protein
MLPAVRAGSTTDDGFIDRLMFAYPEPVESSGWNEDVISEDLREEWTSAVRRLWARSMVVDPGTGRPRPWMVYLTGDARPHWVAWFNAHQAESRHPDFPASLLGPWVKMEGFAGRLVLILSQLHQVYDPDSDGLAPADADALTTWGACRLVEYFKAHYKRTLRDLSPVAWSIPDDCAALIKWFRRSDRATFSERDARNNFVGRFKGDPLALADAVEWLIRHDCVREMPREDKGVGRTHSGVWQVNPYLLDPQYGDSDDSPEVSDI